MRDFQGQEHPKDERKLVIIGFYKLMFTKCTNVQYKFITYFVTTNSIGINFRISNLLRGDQ